MTKTKIRIAALALVFLAGAAMAVHAQGDLPLVNTQSINMEGVNNLSINCGSDPVIIRESETNTLTVQEYMSKDRERYYAKISCSSDSVHIGTGKRPLWPWSWKARTEIAIPRSFRGNLRISNSSGSMSAETDFSDYQTVDIHVSSGSVVLSRVSAQTVSLRVSSGDLGVSGIRGDTSFISVSSGRLSAGTIAGGEHGLKLSSGRIRIGALEGAAAVKVSSGIFALEQARGRLDAEVSSGSLSVGDFSGEGGVKVHSGNVGLDIRELSGDLRFDVSSGGIDVQMPPGLSFNLDAVTNNGSVRITENGAEVLGAGRKSTVFRPIGPSPERTVYARVSSGNLVINRR
ncbi:MAG: DUF4097 domain-containing protein [Treponema sp.]|jgi:DUF4097 and DUF4098 domain-containing protein YvlB|nr:DUF4097 domain-containing protein [Treponema sp.]